MSVYYAKSPKNGFQETVSRHVRKVSPLAGEFANDFGCLEEGRLEGLFHDFGKYAALFQKVLDGTAHRVNHAVPGALYLRGYCHRELKAPRMLCEALCTAVAAHHSQLCNEVNGTLLDREENVVSLSDPKEAAQSMRIFLRENGDVLPHDPLRAPSLGNCSNSELAYMFFVRMLFSALVDADYCVSAQDDRLDEPPAAETPPLRTDDILHHLKSHRQEIKERSTADPKINRLREELYQNCVEAAKLPPGLFTLTAPTGTGKTLSLFAFALLHAAAFHKKRIFIVLPYLSIIKQNADIYRALAGNDLLEDHSQSNLPEGMREFSERWSSPMIVTTSVKFFETLFSSRPTGCRRLHHLANSVVVFDEAQSLPPALAGVTLDTVNALCSRYGCSVVFSTATQPSFDFRSDIVWMPREIVRESARMFRETKRVEAEWRLTSPAPLAEIAEEMAKQPVCCAIVNMRRHARTLFEELMRKVPEQSEQEGLFFITTDLCAAHRDAVLKAIHDRMERHLPCRLVATQCVEAGVDLDFPVLYRALAPLESIVQAAGRCNRNGNCTFGRLVVFIPENAGKGKLYPDDFYGLAAGCVLTLYGRHPIDLDDPAHLREYYELLFREGGKDDPELLHAIEARDFAGVDEHYKLIEKQGVNVVVPYDPELFVSLRDEAAGTGLTRAWMMRARPLTVSSFDRNMVEARCGALYIFKKGRPDQEISSGWYLLGNPADYDKEKMGLQFASGFDGVV